MSAVGSLLVALVLLVFSGPAGVDGFLAPADPGRTVGYSSTESGADGGSPIVGGASGRFDRLVEAGWLVGHLDDPSAKVVALTPPEEFAAGHVPGAAAIDWPELEVTDASDPAIARWQGDVEGKPTRLGVRPEQTVVVYDGGTVYAPRLWWIMTQLGHGDVRVLDGGSRRGARPGAR